MGLRGDMRIGNTTIEFAEGVIDGDEKKIVNALKKGGKVAAVALFVIGVADVVDAIDCDFTDIEHALGDGINSVHNLATNAMDGLDLESEVHTTFANAHLLDNRFAY